MSYIDGEGYRRVKTPTGWRREHRVVAGVDDPQVHVHHVNHDKTDNRPENLRILTADEHAEEHARERRTIDRARVRALYEAGWTMPRIAKHLGTHHGNVSRALRDAGGRARPMLETRGVPVDRAELDRLYRAGLRPDAIGRELGVSGDVVRARLKRWGYPSYPPGRPYPSRTQEAHTDV